MESNDALKARAEAAFHEAAAETKPDAMAEYKARQEAERAKKLRALWLAAEVKAGVKPKANRKAAPAGNKGKR